MVAHGVGAGYLRWNTSSAAALQLRAGVLSGHVCGEYVRLAASRDRSRVCINNAAWIATSLHDRGPSAYGARAGPGVSLCHKAVYCLQYNMVPHTGHVRRRTSIMNTVFRSVLCAMWSSRRVATMEHGCYPLAPTLGPLRLPNSQAPSAQPGPVKI